MNTDKQQTPGEAAKHYAEVQYGDPAKMEYASQRANYDDAVEDFTAGAKWMAAQRSPYEGCRQQIEGVIEKKEKALRRLREGSLLHSAITDELYVLRRVLKSLPEGPQAGEPRYNEQQLRDFADWYFTKVSRDGWQSTGTMFKRWASLSAPQPAAPAKEVEAPQPDESRVKVDRISSGDEWQVAFQINNNRFHLAPESHKGALHTERVLKAAFATLRARQSEGKEEAPVAARALSSNRQGLVKAIEDVFVEHEWLINKYNNTPEGRGNPADFQGLHEANCALGVLAAARVEQLEAMLREVFEAMKSHFGETPMTQRIAALLSPEAGVSNNNEKK